MSEKTGTTDQEIAAAEGQRILKQLHEQGVIDLDAPMRQLFDRLDSTGDVSGYQLNGGPAPDQWWVYVDIENDGKGGKKGRVLFGSDLKDDGLKR